ncbi:NAD(P)/FAD-dependent oxidoreductase [Microbacterium sp. A94]|uniref:NAD(P)/FAD-dependent oxidoreductase n=1 Tax=Microbacterium sp. A94 TaxID=3450717 RepID=UPI003F41ED8E
MRPVVIIGAGQGGTTTAEALRDRGFDGAITLVDASVELPYRRPPLSKAFLSGDLDRESLVFRPTSFYEELDVELALGESAIGIDNSRKHLELAHGRKLGYDHLVIATGSSPCPWPGTGAQLDGVFQLSTVDDAERLRTAMRSGAALTVIGGGFIGMEVASTARKAGLDVTVLEKAERVMARTLTALASDVLVEKHRGLGVTVRTAVSVDAIVGSAGRVTGVRLDSGELLPSDLVLVGVGSAASIGPAGADLCDKSLRAIRVDEFLRTIDPSVSAIGDVAAFPRGRRGIRLESVQNATDQARSVAARLTGQTTPYITTPWFWTEQAGVKLQIAGLVAGADRYVVRGDSGRFSIFAFNDGGLLGAESFSNPADYIAVRALLTHGLCITPEQAQDQDFDLAALARSGSSVAA